MRRANNGRAVLPTLRRPVRLRGFICAAALVVALLAPAAALSRELAGTVVFVPDGDTIMVNTGYGKPRKVRLYGVDCPELGQPFGRIATKAASDLVLYAPVSLTVVYKDKYNRLVAIVTMRDGKTLNEKLLDQGMAWFDARFCKQGFCRDWKKLEQHARAKQRGLWRQHTPTPPWTWRAANPRH